MIWLIIIPLLLIGSGLCGWFTSSIIPLDIPEKETRNDWGQNGMSFDQCATEEHFNETHVICVSEYNHNI